ncbi:MAG: hypothetical protein H6713_29825 [Myxococcales bacterium]|nr:hypothetical protein [Myxococcales bacterium]
MRNYIVVGALGLLFTACSADAGDLAGSVHKRAPASRTLDRAPREGIPGAMGNSGNERLPNQLESKSKSTPALERPLVDPTAAKAGDAKPIAPAQQQPDLERFKGVDGLNTKVEGADKVGPWGV